MKRRPLSLVVALALAAAFIAACSEGEPRGPEPAGPARVAEASFIDLEPVAYAVHGEQTSLATTSSRARLFVSYHAADEAPDEKPLVVLGNGGPGASSGILLAGNTAPVTLDPERTNGASFAANPASWTAFANLLHVDARGTGFSYGIAPGMADDELRAAEFSLRNFHPFLDAADLVRVVLRFLAAHPPLRSAPVVLAGESYGGVRTEIALHLLHHPERYAAAASLYQDSALAAEIAAHFAAAGTTAASQFGRAVFLQARIASPAQQAAAGDAFEAAGSPLQAVADETGVPFVPCSDQPAPCSAFANALDYLASAGRDVYDVRRPAGDAFARYESLGERLEDPAVLPEALGTDPAAIAEMYAEAREEAYRVRDAVPEDEPLGATFGALKPHDRYFEIELFDLLGEPFSGPEAQVLGIERQHPRYGLLFLEDLLTVRAFVTNAAFDAAIWTPALPEALATYSDVVAGVHRGDGSIAVDYAPGAFGQSGAVSRTFRFPSYPDSGHSITFDQPEKLAADLAAFLAE